MAHTAAAENQNKAFIYFFFTQTIQGKIHKCGIFPSGNPRQNLQMCVVSLNCYDDRLTVWSLAFGSQTFPPVSRCQNMSCPVSSLVDLVWIAGAFMQLSTLYVIKKLGTWLPQQEWKTLLLPQALISQPVAEFVHLAEPWCICSPFKVPAWEPNGFVLESCTFTEQKSSGIT